MKKRRKYLDQVMVWWEKSKSNSFIKQGLKQRAWLIDIGTIFYHTFLLGELQCLPCGDTRNLFMNIRTWLLATHSLSSFHTCTNGLWFEIEGVACHLENTLANWPHTHNITQAGVMVKFVLWLMSGQVLDLRSQTWSEHNQYKMIACNY